MILSYSCVWKSARITNASKILKQQSKERIVQRCLETFALESEFGRVTLEQVEREALQESEVLSAVENT
jgi:hypothetical protein